MFMLPDDLTAPLPENSGGDKAAPPSSQVQPPLKEGAGLPPPLPLPLPPANKSSDEMSQDPKSKKALDGESMKG